MPKPPPKGDDIEARLATGRARATRAATAALAANSTVAQPKTTKDDANATKTAESRTQQNVQGIDIAQTDDPLRIIESVLAGVLDTERLEDSTRTIIGGLLMFVRDTETMERKKAGAVEAQTEASTFRKLLKHDLGKIYEALSVQLNGILDTASAALEGTDKLQKEAAKTIDIIKDVQGKVGMVNEATVKIASTTQTYSSVLASKATTTNRVNADPRVIGDQERKARQILVKLFDEEGNNTLDKSLNDLLIKANKALDDISDRDKPTEVKAVAVLKTRKGGIVLTLNSKEAANWIREPKHEIAFTDAFAKNSHIKEREYNLIVPRIPITFDPQNEKHIREVEEVNRLKNQVIRKARWIKPTERRRPDQTHAYAIFTLLSADSANELIKEGLRICGTIVRPMKQKQEPMQCMKCRHWGHFANECKEERNTCGTCGENHRTNVCANRSKVHCASCNVNTHTSWNRKCPEFGRRSAIMDERNPGNSMPYFPTEKDWTLETRPTRIPTDERFPAKFAVNSLPIGGAKRANAITGNTGNKDNTLPPQVPRKRVAKHMYKSGAENPNRIPIASGSKSGNGKEGDPTNAGTSKGRTLDLSGYGSEYEITNGWDKNQPDF